MTRKFTSGSIISRDRTIVLCNENAHTTSSCNFFGSSFPNENTRPFEISKMVINFICLECRLFVSRLTRSGGALPCSFYKGVVGRD